MSIISTFFAACPGAVSQGIIWGLMAIGVYFTYRILDSSDLTVDGSLTTGAAVAVMMIRGGLNPWLGVIGALVAGMIAGLITGLLHTKCKIPAILAGILTQLALYSINLRIMGGKANQPLSVDKYSLIISQRFVRDIRLDNPILMSALIVAVIIFILYMFFGTEIGSAVRATGNNPMMAKAQGIDTEKNVVFGFAISNGFVALSGALLAQYQGAVDINMGRGAIVIGLAAVIIGEVVFGRIFKNFALKLVAVVIGSIIYYLVMQLVLTIGLNTNDLKLLSALIVAIFLTIPNIKKARG